MSTFDEDSFMSAEQTEQIEDKYTPIPECESQALIADIEAKTTKEKGTPYLRVTYELLSDEVKEATGMDSPRVTQTIWLDVNDNGGLATGSNKNVKLGKLLTALGLNGKPWSPSGLKGQGPVLVQVSQRRDDDDPEIIYNDVKRVTAV